MLFHNSCVGICFDVCFSSSQRMEWNGRWTLNTALHALSHHALCSVKHDNSLSCTFAVKIYQSVSTSVLIFSSQLNKFHVLNTQQLNFHLSTTTNSFLQTVCNITKSHLQLWFTALFRQIIWNYLTQTVHSFTKREKLITLHIQNTLETGC